MTDLCLEFSVATGNDLVTPRPAMRFRGLKRGDRWCLHVLRGIEAWEAGKAPRVILEATHENVRQFAPLSAPKRLRARSELIKEGASCSSASTTSSC